MKMEKYDHKYLVHVATDWDLYCDFFGGKNLESILDFYNEDIHETHQRIEYLIREFGV
jgi:hypothetical protein